MKSRLDGFRLRSKDSSITQRNNAGGVAFLRVSSFLAVMIALVLVLFMPDNPLLRYRLGAEASEDFRARVDYIPSDSAFGTDPIAEGTVIISRGKVVDERALSHLKEEIRAYRERFGGVQGLATRAGSIFLVVLSCLAVFLIFLYSVPRSDSTAPLKLLVLGLGIAGAIFCGKLLSTFMGAAWWMFTPLALVTIIAGLSMGPLVAGATAIFALPLCITAFHPHWEMATAICASAAIASFLTRHARKRNHLLRAGVVLGAFNLVIVVAFGLYLGSHFAFIVKTGIFGFLNGLAVGAAATFIFPVVEWVFGVVTDISLIELSDLNHPLLKRMLLQASGTYQHSLIVATISEHAAESIGANALLCKVGSLFHDIGKMVRPKYFVENNPDAPRMHEKLKYSLSAMLIISHTKDGAELAKEHGIPQPVVDIIVEHQGTTKVEYFYNKALQSKDSLALPDEQFFMYPGPKPRSREAAIVMIADAVEALSRTLRNPTSRRIQDAVHMIIMKKLNEGQFDECNITIAELTTIEKSIAWIVQSMFHQRIEYPKVVSEKPKAAAAVLAQSREGT